MCGGYLTLDLREIKGIGQEYGINKKGIYKYIHNTNKPIEIILSRDIANKVNRGKGTLCNTFRINFTNLKVDSELGDRPGNELFLPILYDENYDEVKDVNSIGYGYYKCVITSNDKIYIGEI